MQLEDVKPLMAVVVREWDDMEAEFGLNNMGSIRCPYNFNPAMKTYCGMAARVIGIREPDAFMLHFIGQEEPDEQSTYSAEMLRHLEWVDVMITTNPDAPDVEEPPKKMGHLTLIK